MTGQSVARAKPYNKPLYNGLTGRKRLKTQRFRPVKSK